MTIRLAVLADAPTLLRLNAAFNGVDTLSAEDVRRSLLTSPEVVAVAETDGQVCAFCCAQVHHSFCYPAPVAEVTEMYVAEDHRHKGLALEMLRFLEDHLSARYSVDEIHLLTGTTNQAAQSAYKKAGFAVKNEVYMMKEVRPSR